MALAGESCVYPSEQHDGSIAYFERQKMSQQDAVWLVALVEEGEGDEEFTLPLNADSAQWGSLIQKSHDEARQRLEP
ncbi:hypothetical protein ACMHYQ_18045 [Ectopseudomonas guguanensis]|uniref:hypothetical protein n=1 Tax=Ectopseudomonas guguanensis TaxID=1198456 RepID=UPI0039C08445